MSVSAPANDERIERLSTASLRRIIEPDVDVTGSMGPGMVLPRELLSVADLDLDLTEEQWVTLSREEVASTLDGGIRFESMLMAGLGLIVARRRDLVDPRIKYILHEVGEETRHSRLFLRVVEQLEPKAVNPFLKGIFPKIDRRLTGLVLNWNALFCVLVLTGEEAPDLIQKRSSEHPATDPFLRELNKYHRMEEARHLSFARMLLPELWPEASRVQRWFVRHVAPFMMAGAIDSLIHPGVYGTIGLPTWKTWKDAKSTPGRMAIKHTAARPILKALVEGGVFKTGRIPKGWLKLCQVDQQLQPLPGSPVLRDYLPAAA